MVNNKELQLLMLGSNFPDLAAELRVKRLPRRNAFQCRSCSFARKTRGLASSLAMMR